MRTQVSTPTFFRDNGARDDAVTDPDRFVWEGVLVGCVGPRFEMPGEPLHGRYMAVTWPSHGRYMAVAWAVTWAVAWSCNRRVGLRFICAS